MNSKFQAALQGRAQSTPPIWMMRQAGRYHRHYQKLRTEHGFMELCKNPKLAAEVALGPIEDFDFDVSILFSDLLFPLEALGMGLDYDLGPPRLAFSLAPDSLKKLRSLDQAIPGVEFQGDAVRETRRILPSNKSLIGFVGGPWTLLGYAVDGSHSGGLSKTKTLAPTLLPAFFEKLIPLLKANIQIQLQAGAEAVMILDTAAGELTALQWREWVLPSLQELSQAHPHNEAKKVGYYMRGATPEHWRILHEERVRGTLNLAGIGFDAGISLEAQLLKNLATPHAPLGFVQGNFHQEKMTLDSSAFESELERWLKPLQRLSPGDRRGWICGIGHGLTPQAREENVRNFVQTVRRAFE